MTKSEAWTPGGLAAKVSAVQAFLAVVLWMLLGFWNARHSWLLEPVQEQWLNLFFWRELPALGIVAVVFLPAFWIYRLADQSAIDVLQETRALEEILAFPRRVAIVDTAASVLLFFIGAAQLRSVAHAPAIEAAKVAAFGFVTGVLFGILSFFLLQPVIQPLLLSVLRQGASPPIRPAFPLTEKIVVICLAISMVVTGLFGGIALSWAQRFAEAQSEERARAELREIADDTARLHLHDAAGWKSYLGSRAARREIGTLVVMDFFGRRVASQPEHPSGIDGAILGSEDLRERLGRLGAGTMTLRLGEPRVATSVPLSTGWRIIALSASDPVTLRRFLVSVLPVVAEVLLLSLMLAVAVGIGLTRPLRNLEERTREFARNPEVGNLEIAPTDDEIGALASSFVAMEIEVRSVQARLRETERRAATVELLAGVAHEVRNPLFGITSTAAALAGELADVPRVAPHLAMIRKETDRLARMMEEMLSLERAPSRSLAAAELEPILAAAAERIRSRFAGREIQLSIDCPAKLAVANGDSERLEAVFSNVFENSVLASTGKVRIGCRARRAGGRIEIEIEDDGPGIPPQIRDRLFEPFVSGRAGGIGMGLAVSRQIVIEHGGTIELNPVPGPPTMFRFTFLAA